MSENSNEQTQLRDLASLRKLVESGQGKHYWRSLEELAETEEFNSMLRREFPASADWNDPVDRRQFLKLMAAQLALAGLTACTRQPTELILPYVRKPEEVVPGEPLYFATAMPLGGVATGVLVESHEGRPTKIEGNPDHPASLGATNQFAQASILDLYDPDRAQTITNYGEIRPWSAFVAELLAALSEQSASAGAGLRFLTGTVTSPTLTSQLRQVLKDFPAARWHQYEPASSDGARLGAHLAFGMPVNTIYHFDKADVILSLDSDFLSCGPASLRYARQFTARRRLDGFQISATHSHASLNKSEMNRLYVVESTPSNTGAVADHRLPLLPSQIERFARTLAVRLGALPESAPGADYTAHSNWMTALVSDLQKARGRSIVIAGDYQPPVVHLMAHAINHALGNVGTTVTYTDPIEAYPDQAQAVDHINSLRELVRDMDAGKVELLVIIGCNPVYAAPADLNFAEALKKVKLRIHLSLYNDETSELCHWHIPEAHYLESWSDARAYDGTVTIIQPLIKPLYQGKTAHELLAVFSNQPERSSYDIVREYWRAQAPAGDFEEFWRKALRDGVVANTAFPEKAVALRPDWASALPPPAQISSREGMEIVFRPDPTIHDGCFANNSWLQELPKPLTKLTWDNAALISPHTAEELGLSYKISQRGGEHGQVFADMAELEYQGRKLSVPVWIVPGQSDNCVTLHLGYGRRRAGKVGTGAGFNANRLRTSNAPWFGHGLFVRKTGARYSIACTQFHHNMEGRDSVRAGTLEEYREHPAFAKRKEDSSHLPSLYPEHRYEGYAWGMVIDLSACIGCSACVIACQSENNIPVVGKAQVEAGREMHWLRIDRYYRSDPNRPETYANPETYFQPVPCMHCENAPCEVVCPVAATVHSAEGLNDMVYNRCVGTRYCSNNCPYKVRRFNFLLYSDWYTPSLKLMRNPEVSVRSRGVMEKCTYCVQRINHAKMEAEKEGRRVRDGEIVTACAAVCPAEAIVFGDINDPDSRVARLKAQPRNYALLAELNTRPRTTYLAAVRNPNPEIEGA
jgi:MoCo/4Fe-4S cofactor protein with predicted Tat translocation signal